MPHVISLEPWTPGILESLFWINSFGDDPYLKNRNLIIQMSATMPSFQVIFLPSS